MPGAVELAVAYVSIIPDTSKIAPGVSKALGETDREAEKAGKRSGGKFGAGMGGSIVGLGKSLFAPLAAAAAGVGLAQFFGDAVKGASELQQSVGGVEAVFKGQAGAIKNAAAEAAQNLGLSKNAYNELATVLGAGLKNQGIKDFAGETQNLIGIGGDLAAQYGGSTKEAVEALASAMRGESDPIERYGISLNETAVNAELASKGQDKLKGAALAQAKAMARIAIIQRQSADAQGAFARESDTLAGKQARLSAAWENAKATLGGVLLPVVSKALDVVSGLSGGVASLWASFTSGGAATSGLASAFARVASSPVGQWVQQMGRDLGSILLPALRSIGSAITGELVPAFMSFLNAVVNSPLTKALMLVLGPTLTGLVRGLIMLVKGAATILGAVLMGMIRGVIDVVKGAVNILGGLFKTLGAVLMGDWSQAWEGIKQVAAGAVQALWGLLQTGLLGRVLGVFRAAGAAIAGLWGKTGVIGSVLGAFGQFVAGIFGGIGAELALLFPKFGAFGSAVKTVLGAVGAAFSKLASMVGAAWVLITTAITTAWNAIVGNVFAAIKTWATQTLPAMWRALPAIIGAAWTAVGSAIATAWNAIVSGVFTPLRTWATQTLPAAWNGFKASVSTAWNAVSAILTAAWSTILNAVFTPLRTWATQTLPAAWNGFKAAVAVVWSAVTSTVQAAWTTLLAVFTTLRTWVTATLVAAFSTYRAAVLTVWAAITTAIQAAWSAVLAVFTTLRTWVASTLTAMWGTFRALVAATWTAILTSVRTAWTSILGIFTTLRTWVSSTLTGMWNTFRSLVAAVWTAIASSVRSSWTAVLSVFTTLRTWVSATLTAMWNSFRALVASTWAAITSTISSAWARVLSVFTTLRTWVTSTLTSAWSTLRNATATAWSAVAGAISSAWSRISGYFTNLKNGVNQVWSFFQSAVRGISSVWSGLTGAISRPINAARSWINSNLTGRMNSVLSSVGVSFRVPAMADGGVVQFARGGVFGAGGADRRAASGAVLPGYTPGRDPHMFYSQTGGALALSGGEAVMVPEWTRAIGPGLVKMMNSIARRGGVAAIRKFLFGANVRPSANHRGYSSEPRHEYAAGGVIGKPQRFAGGGVLDALLDPVGAIRNLASSALNGIPGGSFGWEAVKGFGGKLISGVADKVKSVWSSLMGGAVGGGGSGSVMGWQRQWAWAKANLPGVQLHSGYRPGAVTRGSGSRSYHALGRAIDISPSMSMFNKIKATFFKNIRELIFSPANNAQVYNGANHYFANPITRADHFNHVHWAMRDGGVFGGGAVKLFDGGGLLKRGDIGVHAAQKPDRVLTADQWKAVMQHLPLPSVGGAGRSLDGGVHIHGDVYGDPARFAAKVTTRMRDELALVTLQGV